MKGNVKALSHWPLWVEFTGGRRIPRQRAIGAENASISNRHRSEGLCHLGKGINRNSSKFACIAAFPSYSVVLTESFCKQSKLSGNSSAEHDIPDNKVHEANMGHTWVLSAPAGPHVGPMNLAIRDSISICVLMQCAFIKDQGAMTETIYYKGMDLVTSVHGIDYVRQIIHLPEEGFLLTVPFLTLSQPIWTHHQHIS